MKQMRLKKLILLMLALVWLVPCKAETQHLSTAKLMDKTYAERPLWSDIGMYDLLAAPGTTSLTPPSTVRTVPNTSSATATTEEVHHRMYGSSAVRLLRYHTYIHRGYIYLLRCLRL